MPSTAVAEPALRWWEHAWRLAVAWLAGLVVWGIVVLVSPLGQLDPPDYPAHVEVLLIVDAVVGHLIVVLAVFRRRAPVAVAALTAVLATVTTFGFPAALLAVASLATHRRVRPLIGVGALWLASGIVHELVIAPAVSIGTYTGTERHVVNLAISTLIGMLFYAVVALVGWNVGSRRELLASWQAQAATARSEQSARVEQARLGERSRIAREMHDVLAHRLSLVAMHAGALAHRDDIPESERREAAEVIRASTHQALTELREVLGVLRAEPTEGQAARVEAPQPELSGIPALVAEVTGGGQDVTLSVDPGLWQRSVSLPRSTGRHAYRIVQETLTNARKHAPGEAVLLCIDGRPGEGLSVVARNPLVDGAGAGLPASGRGLTGMAERVEVAGGHVEARRDGGSFVVRAWLPWAREATDD